MPIGDLKFLSLNTFPFQLYCILSSKIWDNLVIPYNYMQYSSIQLQYSSIQSLAFLTIITLQHKHSHTYTITPTHTPILTPTHHTYTYTHTPHLYTYTHTHTYTHTYWGHSSWEEQGRSQTCNTEASTTQHLLLHTGSATVNQNTKVRVNQSRFV